MTPAEERKLLRDTATRRAFADTRLALAAAIERHQHRCPSELDDLRCMRAKGHDGRHEAVASTTPVARISHWVDERQDGTDG